MDDFLVFMAGLVILRVVIVLASHSFGQGDAGSGSEDSDIADSIATSDTMRDAHFNNWTSHDHHHHSDHGGSPI